jgi:hypothetical protein
MPEKLDPLSFAGHAAPVTVEVVKLLPQQHPPAVELRLTNNSNKDIRKMSLRLKYEEAGGWQARDWPTIGQADAEVAEEVPTLLRRGAARAFRVRAFSLRPGMRAVRAIVVEVEFTDATNWKAPAADDEKNRIETRATAGQGSRGRTPMQLTTSASPTRPAATTSPWSVVSWAFFGFAVLSGLALGTYWLVYRSASDDPQAGPLLGIPMLVGMGAAWAVACASASVGAGLGVIGLLREDHRTKPGWAALLLNAAVALVTAVLIFALG